MDHKPTNRKPFNRPGQTKGTPSYRFSKEKPQRGGEKKRFSSFHQERRGARRSTARPDRPEQKEEAFVFSPALSEEERRVIPRPEPLPMSAAETAARGWKEVDFVIVTGDPYIDHPQQSAASVARALEADGFRVAILAQPPMRAIAPWKQFGRPRLAFLITAGEKDSLVSRSASLESTTADHPSSHKNERLTLAYAQRVRDLFPEVPMICFGVEASNRRLTHYDYHSDRVRRSLLIDARANLLCYDRPEMTLRQIAALLDEGKSIKLIRDIRGTAFRIGPEEDILAESETVVHTPSFEEVEESKPRFSEMAYVLHLNLNPHQAKTVLQELGESAVVLLPPALPLTEEEQAFLQRLPFTRKAHPSYGAKQETLLKEFLADPSLPLCTGSCAFCALACGSQLRVVDPTLKEEFLRLAAEDGKVPQEDQSPEEFIALHHANRFRPCCGLPEEEAQCKRSSCLTPEPCEHLRLRPELVPHLNITLPQPPEEDAPFPGGWYLAGLPGTSPNKVVRLVEYLHQKGITLNSVGEFIPGPFGLATAMYYTEQDPFTTNSLHVARSIRERRLQYSTLLYHQPSRYYDLKIVLKLVHREDLIGDAPNCLIPDHLSKGENLRRSSQIKRLIKKNQERKEEQEKKRIEWTQKEEEKKKGSRGGFRGGMRSGRPRTERERASRSHSDDSRSKKTRSFGSNASQSFSRRSSDKKPSARFGKPKSNERRDRNDKRR